MGAPEMKKEIIDVGTKLYAMRLAVGSSGNLSCRLNDKKILITATGSFLGDLKQEDVVEAGLDDEDAARSSGATSEYPLHSLIYKNFPSCKAIIHCHPSLINGYFSVCENIKALTFEGKIFLGKVPVVEQKTPTVTLPLPVIKALRQSNIVVLRGHGAVSMGKDFKSALALIETMEEAVRVAAVARLFKKDTLDELDKEMEGLLVSDRAYELFSAEHIQAVADLVNLDEDFLKKSKETGFNVQMVIKEAGRNVCHKLSFKSGKVVKITPEYSADYVISAPMDVWRSVFSENLEPFTAITQGRIVLESGNFTDLSRWYLPLSRLFELSHQIRIR